MRYEDGIRMRMTKGNAALPMRFYNVLIDCGVLGLLGEVLRVVAGRCLARVAQIITGGCCLILSISWQRCSWAGLV